MSIFSRSNLIPAPTGVPMTGDLKKYSNVSLDNKGLGVKDNTDSAINPKIYLYDNNGIAQNSGIDLNINDTNQTHEINFAVKGNVNQTINDSSIIFSTNGKKRVDINGNDVQIGNITTSSQNLFTLTHNGPAVFNTNIYNYTDLFTSFTQTGIITAGNFYFGCDVNENNGVFVIASTTGTAGVTRLYVSGISGSANYLTTFTGITDSVLTGLSNIRTVIYANNIWLAVSASSASRQLWYTTNVLATTGWTQVANTAPFSTTRTIYSGKYINNQFLLTCSGSAIRFSTDGITWQEVIVNGTTYNLRNIVYSPELRRYVVTVLGANVILYYTGTTITTGITFAALNTANIESITLEWSSKLGLFLSRNNTGLYNYSRDGATWSNYTATTVATYAAGSIKWIDDFGGLFIDGNQSQNTNILISRDGFNWTNIPLGTGVGNFTVYNRVNKHIIIAGLGSSANGLIYKDLSPYISIYGDLNNIYSTFNSNTIFNDNIEYRVQTFATTAIDNVIPITSFEKSIISLDTSNSSSSIYMQGTSYNKLGAKFKINKTTSQNNSVLIVGYETCNIITPNITVNSFNFQSAPNSYNIIPAGYFGSFDLTRISNANNGTWLIDNVNIFNVSGVNYTSKSLIINENLTVNGSIISNGRNIPSILKLNDINQTAISIALNDWIQYSEIFINLASVTGGATPAPCTLTILNNLFGSNSINNNFKLSMYIYGTGTETNTINLSTNNGGWGTGNHANYHTNFSPTMQNATSLSVIEPNGIRIDFIYWYNTTTSTLSQWIIRKV